MATIDSLNSPCEQTATLPLALIAALADEFRSSGIDYCLWKGTFKQQQVVQGLKDIDILVARADESRLIEIAVRLGFKAAHTTQQDAPPGVLDFFGYDSESGKIVHLHLHFALIAGDRLTTNYLISLAKPYLAEAVDGGLFRIASPEFEYILFVIRMMLDATGRNAAFDPERRHEIEYLLGRIEEDKVAALLAEHFPSLASGLFQKSSDALRGKTGRFRLSRLRRQLRRALSVYARRSEFSNSLIRFQRRAWRAWKTRVLRAPFPKRRMLHGGTTIALIGGDGAGKSTAIAAMHEWLSSHLDVKTVHLGRPSRSLRTNVIRGLLKLIRGGMSVLRFLHLLKNGDANMKYASRVSQMFWQYCVARDRARTYQQARRFANRGGIVIFDRFPMPEVIAMDGPEIETMISSGEISDKWNWLAGWEKQWYASMPPADLTIVLRLQPEAAIERKPSEDPDFVRERGLAVWHAKWLMSGAHVIDASRPMVDVHHEIRNEIWSRI